jgi:hypothetical protein
MTVTTDAASADLRRWWATIAEAEVPARWKDEPGWAAASTIGEIEGAARAGDDRALGALLRLLRGGDHTAGLVVVRAAWPRLRRAVARAGLPSDDLASPLWLVLASYPLARRPRSILANVVLDTLKVLRAEARERPVAPEIVEYLLASGEELDPVPTGDRVIVTAQRLGLIDGRSAGVLRSVYLDGMPGRVAAVRHATTETAIRWRCSSSVRRLAANAQHLLAA